MDKPVKSESVFAPFVGPFRVGERTIVDRNDDAAVLGNLAISESESDRVLRAICFRMNAPDEPRYTVDEIRKWQDWADGSYFVDDPHNGIAAFTARNKESKS